MKNNGGLRGRMASFKDAFAGIRTFLQEEVNGQIHFVSGIIAVILGLILQISKSDWLWVASAITLVITMELVNSAIERLVDLVQPDFNKSAGKVKDIAAAAVLVSAIYALFVGLVIFIPPLLKLNWGFVD